MKIAVVGSINIDYTAYVENLPQEGETILAKSLEKSFGGKGANQAIAAKKLGGEVYMIGAVGNDAIGQAMKENLETQGVDVSGVKVVDGVSGTAFINVSNKGKNNIIVCPGANYSLTPEDIEINRHIIENCDVVLLQLEIPIETVEKAILLAKKSGKKVILNPAPVKKIPEYIYKYVDIITPNESELKELTNLSDHVEGINLLLEKGVERAIVTLGDKGCIYMHNTTVEHFDAYSIPSVDSTAAGDTFNGALAVKIDRPIFEAINLARVAAALTVTKKGAQDSIPTLDEIKKFL